MENNLISYNKFDKNIQKFVKKVLPISKLNPENRIIVDNGMYITDFCRLELQSNGFLASLRIGYFKEITKKNCNKIKTFLYKIYKLNGVIFEYNNKLYEGKWVVETSRVWIIFNGKIWGKAILELKTTLYNEKNLLFSNEFIGFLIKPIINTLLEKYKEIIST